MIKAIVFDFFGVICSKESLTDFGIKNDGDLGFREYTSGVNLGEIHWEDFLRVLAKKANKSVEEIKDLYHSEKINPNIISLISTLKNNYKIGLITNANHEYIDDILDRGHIADLFDQVIISSRVGLIKPDPKIFELALTKLKVLPKETIYIDDIESYCTAVDNLGINAILYKNFTQFRDELNYLLSRDNNS